MAETGIELSEDSLGTIRLLKEKKLEAIMLRIQDKTSVEVSETKETFSNEDLTKFFKEHQSEPYYVIQEFQVAPDNKKPILISWVPDNAKAELKMLYAGTFKHVTQATGDFIMKRIEANDCDEVSEETIKKKFNLR